MRLQGEPLSEADRIAVTEFLTNRKVAMQSTEFSTGMCGHKASMAPLSSGPGWNGWGIRAAW